MINDCNDTGVKAFCPSTAYTEGFYKGKVFNIKGFW
jgi:hypothetical protein